MDIFNFKAYFISGALGLLIHLVMKFWGEDGRFSDNFLSAATARYVVIGLLLTAASLIMLAPEAVNTAALGTAIAIGIAGGSVSSGSQKIASKGKA